MITLSVIIVSYNVRYYLEQCLRSVRQAARGLDVEILVVDNNSSDGSVEYLEPLFREVRFIKSEVNLGFSKANNLAAGMAKGQYLLFLNPDTIVSENAFADCISFMDSHPGAGITGVCMLNRDGSFAPESRRAVPTPFVAFCKMSGLCALFPKSRVFGKYYLGHLDRTEENRIEVVSGAYMFVRREAFERVGGFDETFFMYGEDVDLSYRILKSGYENWYIPVRILHYKGESTNRTSFSYSKVFYNAMLIFFNKHFRGYGRLFHWAVHLVIPIQTVTAFICLNLFSRWRGNNVSCDSKVTWRYSGNQEHLSRIMALTQAGKDYLTFSGTSLPDSSDECDFDIFDVDTFPYSDILDNIYNNPGRSAVATFNPQTGMLITYNQVINDDGKLS